MKQGSLTDKTTILVFSKAPDENGAKTRLRSASGLTNEWVQALHEAFVKDLLLMCKNSPLVECRVYWHRMPGCKDFASDLAQFPQRGDSFLERLQNAWNECAEAGDTNLILVGSDCPLLSPELLEETNSHLRKGYAVIGPSPAGGFYLLGLPSSKRAMNFARCLNSPLEAVALAELLSPLPLRLLSYLPDVDTEEDLVCLKALLELRKIEFESGVKSYLPRHTTQLMEQVCIQRNGGDTRMKRPTLNEPLLLRT